ncbi:uncharacterized protein [Aegilops tauschii subsp. strangulata]|uniref:Serine/threonine-protein kinase BSK1-like TPR repeats domain-containing protein n=2 Tax=Aegilops tauschii subsp. strangulata TaxID=200361 RepID=A0A453GIS2_AEGTS|nr:ankyrin repeat, PH and SEC7 domain containing protein secG isoform X1 [Aegilops tauschii subsp. strangulata]
MAPPLACGPEAPQCRLLRAAADGDLPLFKRTASLLDGGKGRLRDAVEAVNVGGRAGALHLAAGHGRMAVCVFLVEELRVDVNAADESGDTPLAYAIRAGAVNTFRYLLDHDANPDKPAGKGSTPLHWAATGGNCEIVKALLSKGANVDALCELGTPLHMAAFWKQDGALKILLDHHADCNMVCNTVYSPLLAALSTGSLNCVKLLIKAGADVKGVGTVTPLIMAANNGLTDFYKCLLEAGADPNVRDDVGQLPIEIAAYHNRRKDVEILLPVTSRTPYVRDWSVDGIIRYVKSMPSVEDDPMYKMNPADLKLEGSKAYKRKDYATALELYSLAIHHCPADATLFSNRSLCSLKLGKGDQALMDAELCKMKRPGWAKAYYLQGSAQMLLRVPFSATHECICLLC